TSKEFDIGQYSDTYAKELEKLIEAKSKGQKVSIETEKEEAGDTKDLLEALKASLKVKSKPTTSSSTSAVAKQKVGVQRGG
ncbi:MAG TPA: hypothetical protein VIP70_11495, partial [Nitrososphaeraceae archaeon]